MTSAKSYPICRKCNLNLGIYNQKQKSILPKTTTERRICFYFINNPFCIIWKKNQSTFPTAIEEVESNFRYEETQINDNTIRQAIEYKFWISYEMNCLYNVFSFNFETCNFEFSEYCESHGAGVYHPNKIHSCFNVSVNKKELVF